MDIFEKTYLNIIFEDNYSDETWMKYGSYRKIDFYIRKDRHLLRRLNERYKNRLKIGHVIQIIQNFIKHDTKNGKLEKLFKQIDQTAEFPFTIFAKNSNVYISGRFKANKGVWRCYIATVLPNEETHHSINDYYKEVDA